MPFYNVYPTKDTFITNIVTGSNVGASPVLSVFAQKDSGTEIARALLQFNMTELSGKIYNERSIPSSSVSYILKMFDMKHGETVPTSFDLNVYPLSRSFDEGSGIDADNFVDVGYANWSAATSVASWAATGSDYISSMSASQHFDQGSEDLEMDVTAIVRAWMTGALPQNGLVLKLADTEENNAVNYFIKKFHSRESKFVDKIPYIQARWNDAFKDNRGNFGLGVENKLAMYNFIRGDLVPVNGAVSVRVQDHMLSQSASYTQTFPAYQIADGILTASIFIDNTASFSCSFYDIWYSGSRVYLTGNFRPINLTSSRVDSYNEFVLDVTNLKRTYSPDEESRLKVHVRKKNYKTHIGVVATASLTRDTEYIEKMYYSIENDETGEVVVPFGTGSVAYTQLSYNYDGNYFDMYMKSFVPGFVYRIKFLIDNNKDKKIIDSDFLFKIV